MAPPTTGIVTIVIVVNIFLSISIVLINKWLYTVYGFPNVSLTCIHFVVTSLGLFISEKIGVFQTKSIPIKNIGPLALTFSGLVVFINLSLGSNTVCTYQLIKTMTTPCVMLIKISYYDEKFSTPVKLTMIPISVGVFLNSYYDVQFNFIGIVYATAGVLITSWYQAWVGKKQQEFQMNSMQLLYYQAPLSACLLVVVIPFIEGPILSFHWAFASFPTEAVLLAILSGVVAFFVNQTIYWIISNTSPVSYKMALTKHIKFCVTLMIGYIVFQDPLSTLQGIGIFTTLLGVILYTHLKMQEQKKPVLPQATT